MAYCSNCGAETAGGAFCQKCGAPVAAAPGQPQSPPPQQGGYPQYTPPPASVGMQDNVASALCYVLGLVTGIVFLVIEPYSRNRAVRFHAFQSIFYHVGWIIFWFGLRILIQSMGYGVLGAMLGLLSLLISLVIGFGGFLLWLYLMYRAYNNNPLVLPIIGPIAQQQADKI